MKRLDLTGERYGKLVVLRMGDRIPATGTKTEGTAVCRCDCGTEIVLRTANLRTGRTRSCGCLRGIHKRYPEIRTPTTPAKRAQNYLAGAKKRGIPFLLSHEQTVSLIEGDCYYCGGPGYGIDRIDSSLPYQLSNCRSACSHCNYMKHDRSEADFLAKVREIAEHMELFK